MLTKRRLLKFMVRGIVVAGSARTLTAYAGTARAASASAAHRLPSDDRFGAGAARHSPGSELSLVAGSVALGSGPSVIYSHRVGVLASAGGDDSFLELLPAA